MIAVLRLGHRRDRDKRITTHVALVARAFGADKIVFSGERDEKLVENVKEVVKRWGGDFEIEYVKNWKTWLKNFPGIKIHLTMYGIDFRKRITEIKKLWKKGNDIAVIVGSEKVPREVYEIADYNLAVGNQPHSEVSALAIFLYEMQERKIKSEFENAELKIIPQEKGKKVERIQKRA